MDNIILSNRLYPTVAGKMLECVHGGLIVDVEILSLFIEDHENLVSRAIQPNEYIKFQS